MGMGILKRENLRKPFVPRQVWETHGSTKTLQSSMGKVTTQAGFWELKTPSMLRIDMDRHIMNTIYNICYIYSIHTQIKVIIISSMLYTTYIESVFFLK